MQYYNRRYPWSGDSEDFASHCLTLRLQGNAPAPFRFLAIQFYRSFRKPEELMAGDTPYDFMSPEEQTAEDDFDEILTVQERGALLRDLDRSVVRPRSVLAEKLSQGFFPEDKPYVPREKKLPKKRSSPKPEPPQGDLKQQALILLRELYGEEYEFPK